MASSTDGLFDQDFVRWIETCPMDVSDCDGRESYLNEVRRIRLLLRSYATAEEEEQQPEASGARHEACIPDGTVRLVLRCGEEALRDKLHYHPRMYRSRHRDAIYEIFVDIEDGILGLEDVDDEFCLSEAMPGCSIELTETNPGDAGFTINSFLEKTVRWKFDKGAWKGMSTYDREGGEPKTYWVVVLQDPQQREADLAKSAQRMDAMLAEDASQNVQKDEDGYFYGNNVGWVEGCSCLEGNPCTEFNRYNCKDWTNRYAVALANGWSGKPP